MKKILIVLLSLMMLATVTAIASTSVVPRSYESVLLFDNNTGSEAFKLGIIFEQAVPFTLADIVVFGGEDVLFIVNSTAFAFIDAVVVDGGTLQLALPAEYANAVVLGAYWFFQ
jgi:hypothetical protein